MKNSSNTGIKKAFVTAAAVALAGFSAYTVRADLNVYVTRYSRRSDKVTEHLRIVQISDFHNDHLTGRKLLEKVRSESPDIIVITGDFIDKIRTDIPFALDTAESLAEIAPVYYVPGNHEASVSSYAELKNGLIQHGVVLAGAGPVTPGYGIDLYGIDDPYFVSDDKNTGRAVIKDSLSGITPDSSRYSILLSHRPEAFEEYVSSGFDLVFTGHAHGGQFRLPGMGGIFAPGQGFLPEYDAGEFISGSTAMIVNRGAGKSILPLRIGNPPEIVVLDINRT